MLSVLSFHVPIKYMQMLERCQQGKCLNGMSMWCK